jgi:nucleoside-diphosphate-sugar epimerase
VHGPSQVLLQPTYVADLVRAILAMVDRPFASGTIFNVAGDEALTYPALIDRVARRLGVRARQVRLPAQPTRAIARFGATIARSFGRDVALFTRLREPFVNRTVDISRARETLGFEPVPLEVGIDATIAWARREGRL